LDQDAEWNGGLGKEDEDDEEKAMGSMIRSESKRENRG